jgi:hypothetical protein
VSAPRRKELDEPQIVTVENEFVEVRIGEFDDVFLSITLYENDQSNGFD